MPRLTALSLAALVLLSSSAWAVGDPCLSQAGPCSCCEDDQGPEKTDGHSWEADCCCSMRCPSGAERVPANPEAVAPTGGPDLPDPALETSGFQSPRSTTPTPLRPGEWRIPRPPPVPYPILFGAFLA